MQLLPLGTNGFIPTAGRHTMTFLLVAGEQALLLDAGSGVARFGEAPIAELLQPVRHLQVVLTHYHLDHVVGLSYLPGLWRDRPVTVHAPSPPLTEGDPGTALRHLLAPPLFPHPISEWERVEVRPYTAGPLQAGPFRLTLRSQPRHHGRTVGLRLGDLLAYTTDTEFDPETIPFVAGVGLLMHEVWWTSEELAAAADPHGHSSELQVAEIATAAKVGAVMPVHHHPRRTASELAGMAQRLAAAAGRPAIVAQEGRPYRLPMAAT